MRARQRVAARNEDVGGGGGGGHVLRVRPAGESRAWPSGLLSERNILATAELKTARKVVSPSEITPLRTSGARVSRRCGSVAPPAQWWRSG